jgi:UDP-N-acetyl-D-glucosamine dehydrogenase
MRSLKYQARFIELADVINSGMPAQVVILTQQALNKEKKAVNGSKLLIWGVAYKRDVNDTRESPAFDIMTGLEQLGADVRYFDPHVPTVQHGGHEMRSVAANIEYGDFDAVVVITDHSHQDYDRLLAEAPLIVDTRDALRNARGDKNKVVKL